MLVTQILLAYRAVPPCCSETTGEVTTQMLTCRAVPHCRSETSRVTYHTNAPEAHRLFQF